MIKVAAITLSRSDYASVKPVALAMHDDPDINLCLIAGGSHSLKRFGHTIDDIKADGLEVAHRIDFLNEGDDSDADLAKAYARAVQGFVDVFTKDTPDIVFILGDRWEMMAAATAANMLRLPIAHHSGGDLTQGSGDNQTRYVLSTLSHLHFTALSEHKARLQEIGEEPWRVHVSGEPALTMLTDYAAQVDDIYGALGIPAVQPFALATFHPTTFDDVPPDEQIDLFIKALDLIDHTIVLTAPNPDANSGSFYQRLKAYADAHENVFMFEALGAAKYYAAMDKAAFMIGNSSSGIWEAPSFGLPVINIGRRQDDRTRAANVIDTGFDTDDIAAALKKAKDPTFIKIRDNPYVQANTVQIIVDTIKAQINNPQLLAKRFVDPLPVSKKVLS